MKHLLVLAGLVVILQGGYAQQAVGFTDPVTRDTAIARGTWDTWSVRLFSSRKVYRMALLSVSSDKRIKYTPNNLYSVGVGMTYKFIALDIGINIKPDKEEITRRFDSDLTIAFDRNVIEIGYQRYLGFDLNNRDGEFLGYRGDIRSQLFGFNFYRSTPGRQLSLKSLSSGMQVSKKSTVLFSYGAYWFWDQIKADSSIVPVPQAEFFADRSMIDFSSQFSFGAMMGVVYSLVLPKDLFIFGAASPGLGMNVSKLEADRTYRTPLFPSGRINLRGAIGYAGRKIYVTFSYSGDLNFSGWGDDQRYRYAKSRLKLAVGYRLTSTIGFLEKISNALDRGPIN